jgi:hypothetical protein
LLWVDVQEGPQTLHPLIKKLATMDQDERIPQAMCDQRGGDDRLAECRRGREDAMIVKSEIREGSPLDRQ